MDRQLGFTPQHDSPAIYFDSGSPTREYLPQEDFIPLFVPPKTDEAHVNDFHLAVRRL